MEKTKTEYFELQKKWLSLFDNSNIHWILNCENPDNSLNPKGHYVGKFFTHEDAFETNWNTIVSHTYTPNGNFVKVNEGKKTGDKSIRTELTALQEVYCFAIDLDRKSLSHPKAPDYSRDDLLSMLKRENLPVSFITETAGGWHMYMFVDPKDRKRISKAMYSDLIENFATRFDADVLKDVARIMRIPFSKYYGGGKEDGHVKLFSVEITSQGEYELTEVLSPGQIKLDDYNIWTFQQLQDLHNTICDKVTVLDKANDDRFFDKDGAAKNFSISCNNISIPELFKHIKNYPRLTAENQFEYPVLVNNSTRIGFARISGDGEILPTYETGGYRYYPEKNFVNNFTRPQCDITERPRGGPLAFIKNWFAGNALKTYDFFEKEFGIFRRKDKTGLYMSIEASRGVIDFSTTGVTYTVNVQTKGGVSTKILRLMHADCYPKAVIYTKWNNDKCETDEENIYIILGSSAGDDAMIPYHTDKRSFNKHHGTHGLQFIGDEVAMNDFYQAIWEIAKKDPKLVPTYSFLGTNGFTKDGFLYGKNWFNPDGTMLHVTQRPGIYFGNAIYDLNLNGKAPISTQEFYQKLLGLFPQRIVLISFLTYLVGMAGIDFWEPVRTKINSTKIIPPLFLSGITKAGKSTLSLLMKEGFGLNPNQRCVGIKSITPQPLQQYCTDNITMHVEEYTGMVNVFTAGIVRDIINKNSKQRGNADGTNAKYYFRSNLLLDGEQLPEEESVQNRMIIVPFFENDKCGTGDKIADSRRYCYLVDFIQNIYGNWNNVEKYYLEALKKLQEAGYSDREKELYAYIYTMNMILGLEIPDVLLQSIRENTTILASLGKADPLDEILSDVIFKCKITPTKYEGATPYFSVPLPYPMIAKHKIKLIECTKNYGGAVRIENSCLILEENKLDLISKKIEKFSFNVLVRGPNISSSLPTFP